MVLINDAGFEGQLNNAGELLTSKRNMKTANLIHLKYVDDLTLAEAINLNEKLVSVSASERPLPDTYHARTGHVLPKNSSAVQKQLLSIEKYAQKNEMKFNHKKSKVMIFNPCWSKDFMPELELDKNELEVVEEMRLLGVVVRSDLKWTANTEHIVKKGCRKLWMLRRLGGLGANTGQLVDIYIKHVRSVLELAVPAWHSSITQAESLDIERVQKCAFHIILGDQYISYKNALEVLEIEMLSTRREKLCIKFARKAEKHSKHQQWFKPNNPTKTRQKQEKYCKIVARTGRLKNSPISYLTDLLNTGQK